MEKIKRRLEQEIADLKEQLNEKRQQVEELQAQLARREGEIQGALQRYGLRGYTYIEIKHKVFVFGTM